MPRTLYVLSLVLLIGCGRDASAPSMVDPEVGVRPVREHWDARLYVSEDGVPRVEIEAPYLALFEEADSSYTALRAPDGGRVTARTYTEAGEPSATITADELYIVDGSEAYEARGAVVVTTEAGRRLESERLFWLEDQRRVRAPGFVRITTPTERFQGYELEANEDLTDYRIKRLTGQMEVEE